MSSEKRRASSQHIEMHPRGYPRLAALQSSDPVFTMFRKFATLHARCLLLAQDEICSLEERLQAVDAAERTQLHLSSREHDESPERQALLVEIQNDDLLRFLRLSSFSAPREDNVASLQKWMNAVKPLIQDETRFLDHAEDFITAPRDVEDGSLEETVEKFARRYGVGNRLLKSEREIRKSIDPNLHFYSAERTGVVVRLLLTGTAAFLVIVPTLLLYIVSNLKARLGIICVFVFIFAAAVATMTRAKRHEIFASTAAFSAVLVVFVSNISQA